MRIESRIAELGRDQLLELLGQDVLEHLCLGMHLVPAHAQVFDEEELEQPVVADHLESDEPSALGQPDAPVGLVLDQAEPGELAEHPRDRGGRDVEPRRERVRRGRLAAALEHVDRLDVVLDGRGQRRPVARACRFMAIEFRVTENNFVSRYILSFSRSEWQATTRN